MIYQLLEHIESVILFLIDQTSKKAKRYTQQVFDEKGLDLTVDQMVLLKIIHEHDGLSQQELAERSSRDGASITRTLDLLEKKQYIHRQAMPGNRRQYRISLTDIGQQFFTDHIDLIYEQRRKSLEGFTNQETDALRKMLLRIQHNMT